MMIETAQQRRAQFKSDFQRPTYHFMPPDNWMNDPNGFIHWRGRYHLFYQYNPTGSTWGNMHWGHASSPDLIHWEDLPLALTPTPGGPDEYGCFSGCAVVSDEGRPTLIYTGARGDRHQHQTQCLATGDDDLLLWTKSVHNPILSQVPVSAGQDENFRDPFVWREDDAWYMVVGSEVRGTGGAVFLYRSSDLITWEYLHPLLVGDKQRNGIVWECPNFFPLGDQWVLIVSAHTGQITGTVFYFVGRYEDHHFTPIHEGVLDYGLMYAPLTMLDDTGRRLLIGWIREDRSEAAMRIAGWSGAQSVPRLLALDERQRLITTPVDEFMTLRGKMRQVADIPLTADTLLPIGGHALDISAAFTVPSGGSAVLSVASSQDGQERTDIIFDGQTHHLTVRTLTPGAGGTQISVGRSVPHPLDAEEILHLRLLLDGSVLEIIANDRTSITHRLYSTQPDARWLRLDGAHAHLLALNVWEMPSIWP